MEASRSRPVRMKPLSSRAIQPFSHSVRGRRPRHEKHMTNGVLGGFVRAFVVPENLLKMHVAFQPNNFRFVMHLNVWVLVMR